jgi:hypothetical protein
MGILILSAVINILLIFRLFLMSYRGTSMFEILIISNVGGVFLYWYKYGFSLMLFFSAIFFSVLYLILWNKARNEQFSQQTVSNDVGHK